MPRRAVRIDISTLLVDWQNINSSRLFRQTKNPNKSYTTLTESSLILHFLKHGFLSLSRYESIKVNQSYSYFSILRTNLGRLVDTTVTLDLTIGVVSQ